MTMYIPHIENRTGPKYRIIADAIVEDIRDKTIAPGTKLPTHRDLAYRLGVTVGTITRAYSELQRRGVAGAQVGSGTYVLDHIMDRRINLISTASQRDILSGTNDHALLQPRDSNTIDLSMNRPPPGPETEALAETLADLSKADGLSTLTQYSPAPGIDHHRTAMASWLNTIGLDATGDDIILTNGSQHAMGACALGLLKAGDVILTEELTYPGMTSLLAHVGARVRPVAMDDHGLMPDALESAIRETGARVIYILPIHQNPTTAIMDMDRLQAIADIAKRYDLIVIEDDVYGFQPENRNPPLAQLAPDNTIYINGFAKSIAPGLRVSCLKTPKALFSTLLRAAQTTGWMVSPLTGEIAARWINSGVADDIIAWHRSEMIARNAIAAKIFDGFQFNAKPESLHMWLKLPVDHHADNTIRELNQRGIIMAGPESFVTTQPTIPRALRLCLGSPSTRDQLRVALTQVNNILRAEPMRSQAMVNTLVI